MQDSVLSWISKAPHESSKLDAKLWRVNCVSVCIADNTLEIMKHPCNVDISISDRSRTVSFQCITNQLDAQYLWEMENQTITNRALGVNSSLLVIPNLAVSDAGRYRCTVSDQKSNISSSYAKLTVSGEFNKSIHLQCMQANTLSQSGHGKHVHSVCSMKHIRFWIPAYYSCHTTIGSCTVRY